MKVGEVLRNCREERHLTMRALERKSGITAAQISNLENGRNDAHLKTFIKLLDAMGYEMVIRSKNTKKEV